MRSTEITLEAVQVKLYHADETRTEYIIPKALFDRMLDRGISLDGSEPMTEELEEFLKPFIINMVAGDSKIFIPFYEPKIHIKEIRFTAMMKDAKYHRLEVEGFVREVVKTCDFSGIPKIELVLTISENDFYLLPSEIVLDHFKATDREYRNTKYAKYLIPNRDGKQLLNKFTENNEVPGSVIPNYYFEKHNKIKVRIADITYRMESVTVEEPHTDIRVGVQRNPSPAMKISSELIADAMEETPTDPWDNITIDKVSMALSLFDMDVPRHEIDIIIDVMELLYEKNGNPSFEDMIALKDSISNHDY